MVLSKINRCDIYVCIWALYTMQGILYPQGFINQLLQFIMLFWALYVSCRYLLPNNLMPRLMRAASLLVYMYVIYGLIYLFSGHPAYSGDSASPATYVYLQNSLKSLLPIFLFYHYSINGYLTEKRLRVYLLLLTVVSIMSFQHNKSVILLSSSSRTEITNNMAYSFLGLIPMAYLYYKKPIWQFVFLSVLLFFILIGMKRGAILIGAICFLYFIYEMWKSAKNFKQRFLILLLSIAIISFIVWRIMVLLETSDYFVYRIAETLAGDSSGRDTLATAIWTEFWKRSSVLNILFGHGANSTIAFAGNYAHMDWLETLCNNGFIGVFILLYFYYSMLKETLKVNRKTCPHLRTVFLMLFLIAFLKTLFSMSIQSMGLSTTIMIGYLMYVSKYQIDETTSYNR